MDKFLLQQQVLERLAEDLLQAEQAVQAAHETATHKENIAENKYDTLGLEAGYLATGQARRAEAIRQAMANWRTSTHVGGTDCKAGQCRQYQLAPEVSRRSGSAKFPSSWQGKRYLKLAIESDMSLLPG